MELSAAAVEGIYLQVAQYWWVYRRRLQWQQCVAVTARQPVKWQNRRRLKILHELMSLHIAQGTSRGGADIQEIVKRLSLWGVNMLFVGALAPSPFLSVVPHHRLSRCCFSCSRALAAVPIGISRLGRHRI